MTDGNEGNHLSRREQDNIALTERWFDEVWNKKKIERIGEFLATDVISHYEHDVFKGIDNWIVRFYNVITHAIPDLHVDIMDVMASGDRIVVRWRAKGTHNCELFGVEPTGKVIKVSGMTWVKMVDGKVVESETQWNMAYLFNQLISEVKKLRGILPLCSFCKKIRDDKGYWEQVDMYIQKNSEADVSHSICPDCLKNNYPELYTSSPIE